MVPPTPLRPVCQWSDAELSQLVRGALRGEAEAPPPCAAEQSLLLEDGRSGFVELSQLSKGARYGPFMYVGQGGGTHVAEPTFKYVGHGAGDFHVPEPTPRTYWWLCYPACCLLCCCVLLPLLLALVLRRPQPPAPPADTLAPGGIVCEQAFDTAAQRFLAPDITLAQIHFCCDHFDIGCSLGTTAGTTVTVPVVTVPVATVTTTDGDDGGFSCVTAGENVADTWSEAKKKFCCRNAGVGCLTPPRVVEFDCDAGLPKWDTGWSPMKKDFCCRTAAPVGCPGFTLSTSTTTRVSSSAQEVTAPVGVVAPLSTSAAPKASPGVATEDPGVQCMDFANWPFKDGRPTAEPANTWCTSTGSPPAKSTARVSGSSASTPPRT
ncbi:unnamed protein product [Prorocentrum cordatum]|uniref:Cellulase n=1 Tax=Prorocentrum cordatum TaxID=2364126 RepID=A0ABN9TGD1_9DINO|nr:unnamed protein product [Polarella glacialis]